MTSVPFWREQGAGEAVVCLHSNASNSAQWRPLANLLAERFRVIAVDGHGVGNSPDWPADSPARLDAEVRLLAPVFERAGSAFHLVGHSYGGAVALLAAAALGARVRSLAVYEPTLFSLVAGADPAHSPAAGIWHAASDAARAVARGDADDAARGFVDFWSGGGAWAAIPEARRAAVRDAVRHVGRWHDATFARSLPAEALSALDVPVLLMWGERSPQSSLAVARLLAATLPRVTSAPQPGIGHMGPITDPERVNAQLASFLALRRSTLPENARAPAPAAGVPADP